MTGARSCAVTQTWGDGEHRFRHVLGDLEAEARRSGAGPYFRLFAVFAVRGGARWPHHILRLGLIGGGMAPVEALALVRTYCDERPWLESKPPSVAVLMALLLGMPEDEADASGEGAAAAENATLADGSTSAPSSAPAS